MDIVVLQSRLKDLKIFVKKAVEEAKPDKKLLLSLIEKDTGLMEDIIKKLEEVEDKLELLEGKFIEK